tara:strand:- start:224 stop:541 length:318 start_codon:yes stop_codon:yes gene_type:complete
MSIEEHMRGMDPEAALVNLADWVANIEERAADLKTPKGSDFWHHYSTQFLGEFDKAQMAGLVHQASRDAGKLSILLYLCQRPKLLEEIWRAFTQSNRELAKWLGA